jgi:hypothetical protein
MTIMTLKQITYFLKNTCAWKIHRLFSLPGQLHNLLNCRHNDRDFLSVGIPHIFIPVICIIAGGIVFCNNPVIFYIVETCQLM